MAMAADGASAERRATGSGLEGAAARLQQALGRLESAAGHVVGKKDAGQDGLGSHSPVVGR